MNSTLKEPTNLPGFENIRPFWQPKWQCYCVKIKPGEFYVTDQSMVITTVLGSCVSACIYDEISKIGGMNHFMLPQNQSDNDFDRSMRYGLFAMEQLINEMMKFGATRENMQVKIAGGGNMLDSTVCIGAQNIAFIKRYIAEERLQLTASDVGGNSARKLAYFPHQGRMLVSKLADRESMSLVETERNLNRRAGQCLDDSDVELF